MQTAKQVVLNIKTVLSTILAPYLGQYILPNLQIVPSIAIHQLGNTSTIVYKLVPGSGVECIIEPESDSIYKHAKFNAINLIRRFRIILDQHDATQTLADSLEAIYSHPAISPMEQPVFRPRMQLPNQQGETPARAMIYVVNGQYLQSLY